MENHISNEPENQASMAGNKNPGRFFLYVFGIPLILTIVLVAIANNLGFNVIDPPPVSDRYSGDKGWSTSDAHVFREAGLDAILLANGTYENHTHQEWVPRENLAEMLEICEQVLVEAAARC